MKVSEARAQCEQIHGGPVEVSILGGSSGAQTYRIARGDVSAVGTTLAQAANRFVEKHRVIFERCIAALRKDEPAADDPSAINVETTDGLHVARYRARLAPGGYVTITGRIS